MKIKDILLTAIYPEHVVCCACGREARLDKNDMCESCGKKLVYASEAHFDILNISGASVPLVYEGAPAEMIQRLKYDGAQWLATPLAGFVELPTDWHIDAIAPVPLHPAREKQRGYNQSTLLSMQIGNRYSLPVRKDMLSRIRDTESQTMMDARKRRENVRDAFSAANCVGTNVLVVDDVITTGSTVSECARALLDGGAARVYAAAVCLTYRDRTQTY